MSTFKVKADDFTCSVASVSAYVKGGWVLLQNCHLGLEFMDELLETISTAETMHETVRVWITTEPHDHFSITLLQVTLYKAFMYVINGLLHVLRFLLT